MTQKTPYKVRESCRFRGEVLQPGRIVHLFPEEVKLLEKFLHLDQAEETDSSEQLIQDLTLELGLLQGQLNSETGAKQNLVVELDQVKGELTTARTTIDSLNGQLASRESDLDELTAELTLLREENEALKKPAASEPSTPSDTSAKSDQKKGGKK